jgi:hypothetical protein
MAIVTPCKACGADCTYDDLDNDKYGACEGQVKPVEEVYFDDEHYYIHVCEKHRKLYDTTGPNVAW